MKKARKTDLLISHNDNKSFWKLLVDIEVQGCICFIIHDFSKIEKEHVRM